MRRVSLSLRILPDPTLPYLGVSGGGPCTLWLAAPLRANELLLALLSVKTADVAVSPSGSRHQLCDAEFSFLLPNSHLGDT